jgi:hypothetical protein
MTGIEMRKEASDYLTTQLEERKNAGITKVPMFDERDVLQAFSAGLLNGLRRHSHDYLVKTADLKKRYEKQKEINKELVDENEELKQNGWHNLKKHLQDLPKEDGAVLVVDMDYGHPGYNVALFWKKDGTFTGHRLSKLDVIAWREIPVFQEGA